jgi:periplasmic protein TonB
VAGFHLGFGTLRHGFELSLMLHCAALLCLVLAHTDLRPHDEVAAYEVILVPAAPGREPTASLPAEPEQQPIPSEPIQTLPAAPATTASEPSDVAVQQAVTPSPTLPPEIEPRPSLHASTQPHPPARTLPSARPAAKPQGPVAPSPPPIGGSPPPAAAPVDAAVSSAAWLAGVNQWLLAHTSYPEMARRLGREGTVVLRFTIDHQGHVLDVSLVRGSGSDLLDRAAQALLQNAHLPPFPPDMPEPRQTVTVPIHYQLN